MSSTRPREEVSSTGGLQGQEGPHRHLSIPWVSKVGRGGGGYRGGWGPAVLSAQRGVNSSVAVSFVLLFQFLFFFPSSWKVGVGLVGVVALCGGVGHLVGGGSETIRANTCRDWGGEVYIHRRGRKRGTFSARLRRIRRTHRLTRKKKKKRESPTR